MSVERRAPRWSSRIPVRYQTFQVQQGELQLGSMGSAYARDVGSRGLFLAGTQLPLGTRMHLYFELSDGNIEVFGEVVHARPRIDPWGQVHPGVGLQIDFMASGDRLRLDHFLELRREATRAALRGALERVRAERTWRDRARRQLA